jgi:hypothetical protein
MFIERYEFKCSGCDHVSSFVGREVRRRSGQGEHEAGVIFAWCHGCRAVVHSEEVPSPLFFAALRADAIANEAEPIEGVPSVAEVDELIEWRKHRQSYPRCLKCFSESIAQEVEHPQGGGESLLLHPACGGRFRAGLQYEEVAERPSPLLIDADGHPIEPDIPPGWGPTDRCLPRVPS